MSRDTQGDLQSNLTRLALATLLCLVAASCGLCDRVKDGEDATRSAATFAKTIPADADLAVFAGDWKHLRDALGAVQRRLGTQFPIEAGLAELKRALGVDLTNIKEIESKGIQTDRGLAMVLLEGEIAFLFAVENINLFETLLKGVAAQRWNGADAPIEKTVAGKPVKMLLNKAATAEQGQTPPLTAANVIFAWSIQDGMVVLVPGQSLIGNSKDPEITLSRLLGTTDATSLTTHASYTKLTDLVGNNFPIYGVYNLAATFSREAARTSDPGESEDLKRTAERFDRVGLGLRIDDGRATLHALALTQPEVLAQLRASTAATADFKLQGALTDTSPILLKAAVDPKLIIKELASAMTTPDRKEFEGWLKTLKEERGLDVEGAIMPALDGNLLATVNDIDQKVIASLILGAGLIRILPSLNAAIALGLKDRDAVVKSLLQAKDASLGLMSHANDGGLDLFKLRAPGSDDQANPLLTFVVGPAQLVLLTPEVDPKAAMTLAKLESTTRPAVLSLEPADKLLTERTWSGLVIDVEILADKIAALGDQRANRLTAVLAPFKAWILTSHATEHGFALDLNLIFKTDPAGGGNDGQTP